MTRFSPPTGMKAFVVVWVGQVVSLLGTSMTIFAVTIWAYQETGRATDLAHIIFFSFAPTIILSPFAGALVDRWNRKLVMIISDLASGLATIVILILFATGRLEIWQLYVTGAFSGIFQAFQFPAYSASITLMLPKSQYARASGMLSLAQSASGVLAPVLAAAILGFSNLGAILVIDIVTFVVAVLALFVVYIPQPERSVAGAAGAGSLWQESAYGFRYIWERPSLLGLQLVFTALNFVVAFAFVLSSPMILARTGNNEIMLGSVQSIGAVGGVIGGLLLSTWGGPKRRIHGVLLSMFGAALFGEALLGMGQVFIVWAVANFILFFTLPMLNGSNQAIWQAKVQPDVQGRVFSVRRLIAQASFPLATLLAGPLADQVFEPAMEAGGALAESFSWLVGTGPGAGMGLMLVIFGITGAFAAVSGYLIPAVRNVESLLPDFDAEPLPAAEPAGAPLPPESEAAAPVI